MEKRDAARLIREVHSAQKEIWLTRYKKLRNLVNSKISKECKDFNKNRIDKANKQYSQESRCHLYFINVTLSSATTS